MCATACVTVLLQAVQSQSSMPNIAPSYYAASAGRIEELQCILTDIVEFLAQQGGNTT